MHSKLKLVPHSVRDSEVDHVLDLARVGMSRRLIATEVFGKMKNGEPDDSSLQRVAYILAREQVGVTEYRNGKNATGRAMIAAIRREANVLTAIRTAATATTAAMKKKVG